MSDGGLTLTSDAPFKHVLLVRPTPQGHLGRHLEHTTEMCCFEALAASKVRFEDAEPRMVGEILGKRHIRSIQIIPCVFSAHSMEGELKMELALRLRVEALHAPST